MRKMNTRSLLFTSFVVFCLLQTVGSLTYLFLLLLLLIIDASYRFAQMQVSLKGPRWLRSFAYCCRRDRLYELEELHHLLYVFILRRFQT